MICNESRNPSESEAIFNREKKEEMNEEVELCRNPSESEAIFNVAETVKSAQWDTTS